jgi:hypothetical protein
MRNIICVAHCAIAVDLVRHSGIIICYIADLPIRYLRAALFLNLSTGPKKTMNNNKILLIKNQCLPGISGWLMYSAMRIPPVTRRVNFDTSSMYLINFFIALSILRFLLMPDRGLSAGFMF